MNRSGLFLLYVMGSLLQCFLWFVVLLMVFFFGGEVRAILPVKFFNAFIMVHILRARVFYAILWFVTFEIEVLLSVCEFVVNVCDNLGIFIFNEDI